MKPYESNLKITDELERRVAQQQFDDLSAVGVMVIVQLLVASFLVIGTAILLGHRLPIV
ncbi:MAG TPA: hypothetical protein VHE58_00500 [Burkholderiales bacterium]|nr:hypothetical protein [Burkholderiales bacterium]